MILCHYCGGIAAYATCDQYRMMVAFCARCRMMDADIRAAQKQPQPQPVTIPPETLIEMPNGEVFTRAQVERFIQLRAAKGR